MSPELATVLASGAVQLAPPTRGTREHWRIAAYRARLAAERAYGRADSGENSPAVTELLLRAGAEREAEAEWLYCSDFGPKGA